MMQPLPRDPERNPFDAALRQYLEPMPHAERVLAAKAHVAAMRENLAYVEGRESPRIVGAFRDALSAAERAFRSLLH